MTTAEPAGTVRTDRPDTTTLERVAERHRSYLCFNVMADRPVEETLHVREYRVGDRYVEAHFDREYRSAMEASPSHLIFLSALVHTQKMLYVGLCREFGLDYDPDGPERFKMWPTKVEVKMPTLVADEQDLVQTLHIRRIAEVREGAYRVTIDVRIGTLQIRAVVPTFMLPNGGEEAA